MVYKKVMGSKNEVKEAAKREIAGIAAAVRHSQMMFQKVQEGYEAHGHLLSKTLGRNFEAAWESEFGEKHMWYTTSFGFPGKVVADEAWIPEVVLMEHEPDRAVAELFCKRFAEDYGVVCRVWERSMQCKS